MCFCTKKPTMMSGTMVAVAAALLRPQSTEMAPTNPAMPTGSV
jgi:hypothetical protein